MTRATATVDTRVDQGREDGLGDPAAAPRLVDDQDGGRRVRPRCTSAATGSGASQRRSRTVQPNAVGAQRAAARRLMKTPLPNVTSSRSRPVP